MIVKFTVTAKTAAYLRWLADNVFLVKTEHEAAHILMRHRLSELRREANVRHPTGPELDQLTQTAEDGDESAD